jgi:hypothetical protein
MIMKLGALLAAGKSLALGRRGESPYRANKQVYLPKFSSPKNPFAATAETEAESETAGPAAAGANAVPLKKEAATKTQKLPTLPFAVSHRAAAIENRAAPFKNPGRSLKWMSRLNPFVSETAFPAARGKNAKTPVQAELSLDAVKVLRNDLSDVDVEIVPLKSHPPSDAVEPGPGPAKNAWGLLGERFLKMKAG